MKLLIFSRYDRQGASSRLRTMQYIPYLNNIGFDVHVKSLFDANYLGEMYAGRRSSATLAKSILHRMGDMRERADVIWLEKEALPWFPWGLEKLFWQRSIPVVADFDDAIFHRYDKSRHFGVRAMLGQKIDKVMSASIVVTAGNHYLAERAYQAGANRVEVFPTVVDTRKYQENVGQNLNDSVRVGWIGTPYTWSSYAESFATWIEEVALAERAIFRVVGGEQIARNIGQIEYLPWSEDTEIQLIQEMDIGLMPVSDTPFNRGKCGYKLIQYMACGLPVIASPVGVNCDLVEHGVNGFLAETREEWQSALVALIRDPSLRQRMGCAGRKVVETAFSLQTQGPRMAQLLRSISEKS